MKVNGRHGPARRRASGRGLPSRGRILWVDWRRADGLVGNLRNEESLTGDQPPAAEPGVELVTEAVGKGFREGLQVGLTQVWEKRP